MFVPGPVRRGGDRHSGDIVSSNIHALHTVYLEARYMYLDERTRIPKCMASSPISCVVKLYSCGARQCFKIPHQTTLLRWGRAVLIRAWPLGPLSPLTKNRRTINNATHLPNSNQFSIPKVKIKFQLLSIPLQIPIGLAPIPQASSCVFSPSSSKSIHTTKT
ncbi:unnamed protein product [Chondrus crispus]|uniref:Uncharacterized protein n=1 Tax=Chondrus crispus TaxID=2769 RepID=R7QSF7_CHOCR|nr:unnamed protein product [Chondrus crispus]CDF41044.1 unnamed protein product [Chondrus crispus]|eukprot:XP_005711338.1 unnamed protein product [Chondrus crispus]